MDPSPRHAAQRRPPHVVARAHRALHHVRAAPDGADLLHRPVIRRRDPLPPGGVAAPQRPQPGLRRRRRGPPLRVPVAVGARGPGDRDGADARPAPSPVPVRLRAVPPGPDVPDVRGAQARPQQALRGLRALRAQDGPPLRLHQQLRRVPQPAVVPPAAAVDGRADVVRGRGGPVPRGRERAPPPPGLVPLEARHALRLGRLAAAVHDGRAGRRGDRVRDTAHDHDEPAGLGPPGLPRLPDLLRHHDQREHEVAGLADGDGRRLRV